MFWVSLFVTALAGASPAKGGPWYMRTSCDQAASTIYSADFDLADEGLKRLEGARDLDDMACAILLRVALVELRIAVEGKLPGLLADREKLLGRMYGFARANGKFGSRFSDLEMEARMRRVRVLLEKGERNAALKEARAVKALLAAREGVSTPTLEYVRGIINMAVSQSAWPLRTLLGMAGVSGDGDLGRASLRGLFEGTTVYRYDARYVMRHFAEENPIEENGKAVEYSGRLRAMFPKNPQFTYDYAYDLRAENRCREALVALVPVTEIMEKSPSLYSQKIRAKYFWLSGCCAHALGQSKMAERYVELAAKERWSDLDEEIDKLRDELHH